ncbi:Aldehyde dehydrogenase [metagenome]|uniref:aldehyde dehydrogenase (NAD(+)) n=1 Tax=metagenome TaxID=256318 RepID=A0A2P2C3W1_9ZZZZ
MNNRSEIYVDGSWTESSADAMIDVVNPTDETIISQVPAGSADDVDVAVRAARRAFPGWSGLAPVERSRWLGKLADGLWERREEIARLVSLEVGAPYQEALAMHVVEPIAHFSFFADHNESFAFDGEVVDQTMIVREAIGVVGCITPWNFPFQAVSLKVSPALAAGCTVVLKPSEVAPLTAFVLAEVVDAIGFPAGVFNLVSGIGPVVGEAIASHPEVDMVSFTGSTRAGTRVSELAASGVKRVTLELGGKSANIILADANLPAAVENGVSQCFMNAGQTCSALTRMLVPRELLTQVEQLAKKAAESYVVGGPFEETSTLGPLVSAAQHDRVRNLIDVGIEEGATLVTGGSERPRTHGYFVAPTVFSDVNPKMRIAREEIFGPVLCIIGYDSVDEAVEIANDSDYGLGGGVWGADQSFAIAVARRIRTGQVAINGGTWNPRAPFGGYKHSGLGREGGEAGFEEFLETKAILLS